MKPKVKAVLRGLGRAMMVLLVLLLLLSFLLEGMGCSGGADRGESCDKSADCAEGLRCIPFAMGCTSDCPGTCEEPCSSNADCGPGDVCVSTRGASFCEVEDFHFN